MPNHNGKKWENKSSGMLKQLWNKISLKQVVLVILISDKRDIKGNTVIRDKEGQYIVIKISLTKQYNI